MKDPREEEDINHNVLKDVAEFGGDSTHTHTCMHPHTLTQPPTP